MTTAPEFPTLHHLFRGRVLFWFTGKARDRLAVLLDALEQSMEQRYWLPGISRALRAALKKSAVARQFCREARGPRGVDGAGAAHLKPLNKGEASGWRVVWIMEYGQLDLIARPRYGFNFLDEVEKTLTTYEQREALGVARQWWTSMMPVALAMQALDLARPPPVLTRLGVSPLITATLSSLQATKVELCPTETRWVWSEEKQLWIPHMHLLWPAGTQHWTSPHLRTSSRFSKCHSCGHAIRNPGNWVPLVLTGADAVPRAYWVGRDCAESLFGVHLSGTSAIWAGAETPVQARGGAA